jgi:AcrR family transcriptional regulator
MPKKVDHRTRRATIARSAWTVAAHGGIEAVTMRHVAAAAGISLGQLQHYFTTKEQLLAHAYDLLIDHLAARTSRRKNPPRDEDPEPRDTIRDILTEMLPLDEQRTTEAHFLLTLLARAAVSPDLAARLHKTHTDLHTTIADQIRHGQRRGTAPLHLDPARETRTLLAVLDGLTTHVLVGHHSAQDARHALDDHLDRLFST